MQQPPARNSSRAEASPSSSLVHSIRDTPTVRDRVAVPSALRSPSRCGSSRRRGGRVGRNTSQPRCRPRPLMYGIVSTCAHPCVNVRLVRRAVDHAPNRVAALPYSDLRVVDTVVGPQRRGHVAPNHCRPRARSWRSAIDRGLVIEPLHAGLQRRHAASRSVMAPTRFHRRQSAGH